MCYSSTNSYASALKARVLTRLRAFCSQNGTKKRARAFLAARGTILHALPKSAQNALCAFWRFSRNFAKNASTRIARVSAFFALKREKRAFCAFFARAAQARRFSRKNARFLRVLRKKREKRAFRAKARKTRFSRKNAPLSRDT